MKSILVTGGAGYIGSHAVRVLVDSGYSVTVIDNLSKGHQAAVDNRAVFLKMDLADAEEIKKLFSGKSFDAVLHFAGSIEVGLSMKEPALFFKNNVVNGLNLLEAMRAGNCRKIIFSSTAAVYGNPKKNPIAEDAELNPTNFYGESKLMFEQVLQKYREFYGFEFVALRYFNAAGADASGKMGQDYQPDTHLIPRLLKTALGKYESLQVFGTDYETKDGTCVRDYIHVTDLVNAHLLALEYLLKGGKSDCFNLANGNGFTVREVIAAAEKITGKKIKVVESARRAGDPPMLIADSSKAKKILGWNPRFSLDEIISSAWKWHSVNPAGYSSPQFDRTG
jgi:UDP-glucose 4-epimerase